MSRVIAGKTIDEDHPEETVSHDYLMSAPAGSRIITPLTTILAS